MAAEVDEIAICMATFNPDPVLFRRQVDSIRAQDRGDWTCIVCDDGSDAGSLAEIKAVLGSDERFQLHAHGERLGFYRNFERALGLVPAAARFVAFCDQ